MRTIFTVVVDSDEEGALDHYNDPADYLHDLVEGRVIGTVTIEPVDPYRYDGDPRNEVADLATSFDIITAEQCRGLKEDHVCAEYETCGGRRLEVDGPVSWALPILRAANGIN
jgi:hypothetical protein